MSAYHRDNDWQQDCLESEQRDDDDNPRQFVLPWTRRLGILNRITGESSAPRDSSVYLISTASKNSGDTAYGTIRAVIKRDSPSPGCALARAVLSTENSFTAQIIPGIYREALNSHSQSISGESLERGVSIADRVESLR